MTAALRDNLVRESTAPSGVRALAEKLRRLAAPAAVGMVVAGLLFAVGLLARWVHDATLIDVVRVEGSFRASTQQDIEQSMSSLVAGHSLLNVPMDEIARELSALSWVSAVDVYRVWPHGLIVRVTEKVPVAHWNGDGFISHTGDVFQPENAGDVGALPMLAGPADKARHVMAFYSVANSMLLPFGLSVQALTLNNALSWEVVLANGIRLRLDQDGGEARLRRFLRVYEQRLYQITDRIDTVDLRYIGGFAVGWKPAAAGHAPTDTSNTLQAGATAPGGKNGTNQ